MKKGKKKSISKIRKERFRLVVSMRNSNEMSNIKPVKMSIISEEECLILSK